MFQVPDPENMDTHAKIGEKNLDTDTDQCGLCSSWVGAKMERIPQPSPDYSLRQWVLDDYNPRVQLKNLYEAGGIFDKR